MRVLAIGDIHGCSTAFDTLLESVGLEADDTLVTLGDYVDRGPDTPGVLERMIDLCGIYHVVALRGNHDQRLLQARDGDAALHNWREDGGDATSSAYGGLDAIPRAHWRFLEDQCIDFWETETHFFVHASVYPTIPLFLQPRSVLHGGKIDRETPHLSGKIMVCGHRRQKNGLPLHLGHAICLDTGAYGGGWLSCLDIASGQVWQANQKGQTRMFPLAEPVG